MQASCPEKIPKLFRNKFGTLAEYECISHVGTGVIHSRSIHPGQPGYGHETNGTACPQGAVSGRGNQWNDVRRMRMTTNGVAVYAKTLGALGAYMGFFALALGTLARGV